MPVRGGLFRNYEKILKQNLVCVLREIEMDEDSSRGWIRLREYYRIYRECVRVANEKGEDYLMEKGIFGRFRMILKSDRRLKRKLEKEFTKHK